MTSGETDMSQLNFKNAYYIKLGGHGKWEESSITENKLRFGWRGQTLDDINQRNWTVIERQLKEAAHSKSAATRDINALKMIVESTSDDIWITFHASHLWWCRVGEPTIFEDKVSRYRKLVQQWCNCSINGMPLILTQIPGRLSKMQGFQGTVCKVREIQGLKRLINDQPSEEAKAISRAKESLVEKVNSGLKLLHWKDFETLVDLVFRNAGWRRISLVGETMKYSDMELEEPVTGELYQVQVKSRATVPEFEEYARQFAQRDFRKLYFVVHTPQGKLASYQPKENNVELILPERLAEMVVDFGLVGWVMKKIR